MSEIMNETCPQGILDEFDAFMSQPDDWKQEPTQDEATEPPVQTSPPVQTTPFQTLPVSPRRSGMFDSDTMSRLPIALPPALIEVLEKPGPRYAQALKLLSENLKLLAGTNEEAIRLLQKMKDAERAAVHQALYDREVFLEALHVLSYFLLRQNSTHIFPSDMASMKKRYEGNELLKNFMEGLEKSLFKKTEVVMKRKVLSLTVATSNGTKRQTFALDFAQQAIA
jgi:hypothetical protein